jgi:hypothetical protein
MPSHTALYIKEFFEKELVIALKHLAFSSDLAPFDMCLFPIMKNQFTGSYFEVAEKIQKNILAILNGLQKMSSRSVSTLGEKSGIYAQMLDRTL